MTPRFIVSIDLGQSIDPTAVSVLEVATRANVNAAFWAATPEQQKTMWEPPREWYSTAGSAWTLKYPTTPARIDVRHLERLPLRVPYPEQIQYIASLLRRPPLAGARPDILFDQTGVGRPVVDLARRGGLRPIGITITAGNAESHEGDDYRVAKLLLVSRLQAVFHSGELRIAKTLPEARTLVSELQDFRGIFTDTGYARFGAREGAHDDLVLSVAQGVWWAYRGRPVATTQVLHI